MLRSLGSFLVLTVSVAAQTNFPPPVAPPNNPVTQNKTLLGMALFFEEQLSSTSTVACATCHDFRRGGVDARTSHTVAAGADALIGTADDIHSSPGIPTLFANGSPFAHPVWGIAPQQTLRRAPTVINSGYHQSLAYDGSKTNLEDLIRVPPLNVVEMGHIGRTWNDVAQKIAAATPLRLASDLPSRLDRFIAGRTYPDLFQLAFGSPQVTEQTIVQAIASYLRTLNSDQSRWDLHLHNQVQLTPKEQHGLTLFTTVTAGATSCHTCHGDFEQRTLTDGPRVGQMTMTPTGPYGSLTPVRLMFHNVGIRPIVEDAGRANVTQSTLDGGKFRVASLRNVELTAPYFHNGSARTLHEVIDFYDRGGDFHANQAANLLQRGYTAAEKDALVAILQTLTDPRVAAAVYPFDQPTLGSENGRLAAAIGRGAHTASGPLVAAAPYAPLLGETRFRVTLSGLTPGAFTFLLWDLALSQQAGPFGLALAVTPVFHWYGTGPGQVMLSMAGTGMVDAPMPLPLDPALRNLTLYSQWLVFEPSGTSPVALSNTLRIPLQ